MSLVKKECGLLEKIVEVFVIMAAGDCDIASFECRPHPHYVKRLDKVFEVVIDSVPDYFCGVIFDSPVSYCKIIVNDTTIWETDKSASKIIFEKPQMRRSDYDYILKFSYVDETCSSNPKIMYEVFSDDNMMQGYEGPLEIDGEVIIEK